MAMERKKPIFMPRYRKDAKNVDEANIVRKVGNIRIRTKLPTPANAATLPARKKRR